MPGPVRLLAILLRLTPRSFRERHGPQVLEDAEERLRGGSRRSRFLRSTRMALDVLCVAASLRLAPPRARAALHGRVSMGLAHGVRAIRRSPALALLAVPMVGLGVGAVTIVYSVGTTLLVRPLPFDDPHELLWISNGEWGRGQALSSISVQVSHLQDIQAESRTFTQVAGFHLFDRAGDHTLYGQGEPRRVTRLRVTPGFLPLLGVEPLHGRLFDDEESVYGGPPAILLTHDLWATSFRRDPAIVGQAVTIDDEPVTVVGVLPATFDFPAIFAPGTRTDFLAPFPLGPETDRSGNTLALIGRLASGATLRAAQSELTAIAARHQAVRRNSFEPRASPLRMHLTGSFRSSTFVLAASVALVMLIVCANLSNLLLAHGAARRRELAVRTALGAGKRDLLGQMLAESLVLALVGGAVGIALAYGGTHLVAGLDTRIPLLSGVAVDRSVLAFALAISIASGLVFGLLPAARASMVSPFEAMAGGGRGSSSSRREGRVRSGLVVGEVALACVLLVGAGLLSRSFLRLTDVEMGFDPGESIALRIDPTTRFETTEQEIAYYDDALHQARQVPGVVAAGLTDVLPVGFNRRWCIDVEDVSDPEGQCGSALTYVRLISDGYVEAMGLSILVGRDLEPEDDQDGAPVVLINDVLAERLWPDGNPLDHYIRIWDREPRQVVGVTRGMRHLAPDQPPAPEVFFPLRQVPDVGDLHLIASPAPGADIGGSLREALRRMDPDLALDSQSPVRGILDSATSPRRFTLLLVVGFALASVALASLGVYGVVSYSVTQRRAEMGIRLALGAQRRSVWSRVLMETMGLAGLGLTAGLLLAALSARLLESQLFGVTAWDLPTFSGATIVLALVTGAAGLLPALRASRIDPARTLASDS